MRAPPGTTPGHGPRHSLWLLPPDETATVLRARIHSLAHRYDGPLFEPHITLLGSIPGELPSLTARLDAIVSALEPMAITLTELAHEPVWSRALMVRARRGPTLMAAGERIRNELGWAQSKPFDPHLSLFYAITDPLLGARIMATLSWSPISFVAARLSLVDTTGPVHHWTERCGWQLTDRTAATRPPSTESSSPDRCGKIAADPIRPFAPEYP